MNEVICIGDIVIAKGNYAKQEWEEHEYGVWDISVSMKMTYYHLVPIEFFNKRDSLDPTRKNPPMPQDLYVLNSAHNSIKKKGS